MITEDDIENLKVICGFYLTTVPKYQLEKYHETCSNVMINYEEIKEALKLKQQIKDVISASKRVRSQGIDTTDYPKLLESIL